MLHTDKKEVFKPERLVGGELVSSVTVDSSVARVEILRRKSAGKITWSFMQPEICLFWFRGGVKEFRLDVGARTMERVLAPSSNLAIIPPMCPVYGEFAVNEYCDYVVVFLDPEVLMSGAGRSAGAAKVGFFDHDLHQSFAALVREVHGRDEFLDTYVRGWSLQASAYMARIFNGEESGRGNVYKGGLSATNLRRVRLHVSENLTNSVTVDELSNLCGLSYRHFVRAFKISTGVTPHRYVTTARIDAAKTAICEGNFSITDIAIEYGFSHAQHFSTVFKNETGLTPSQYRALSRT
jgi:AraC family transcriptional regulator